MEKQNERMRELMRGMHGGCSAVQWTAEDGTHLWGRNFDFNRLAAGTGVVLVPRDTAYAMCGCSLEHTLEADSMRRSRYAAMGMGFLEIPTTPVLYEGVNEKGLMGGQLYYREFAHFETRTRPGTARLQPPFVVYHLLAQCASVEEVVRVLEREVTLVGVPLFGTVPPLHWMFTDRTGESIVVEPDRTGLRIYRNTAGVMTNSPGYDWHRLNLLNYAGVRPLDYDTVEIGGERLTQCFSGSGAAGLPGDWSSPSRFIRLAFLRQYGCRGADEREAVSRLFHVMDSAAFPMGLVQVSQPGEPTAQDEGVVPYDYTVYTAVMCAESGRYYWTTHGNRRVQYVSFDELRGRNTPLWFAPEWEEDLRRRTDGVPRPGAENSRQIDS